MEEKKAIITFDDIKKANESIMTTEIKGKEYAEVNQRIKAFRMCYPTGTIETEMVSNKDGVCIFRAIVGYYEYYNRFDENPAIKILATGTAYEKENSTFINKTSYIENCETSAIGRALGIAGFGIDTSVASAEEVQNAIANQKEDQGEKLKLMARLNELRDEVDYEALLNYYQVSSNAEMTIAQLKQAIKRIESKEK